VLVINDDVPVSRQLASERARQFRALDERRTEKQNVALHALPISEYDRFERSIVADERNGQRGMAGNARSANPRGAITVERLWIDAEGYELGTPSAQFLREANAVLGSAEDANAPISKLPSVTMRTDEHAATPALADAGDRRKLVAHTCCEHDAPCPNDATAPKRRSEYIFASELRDAVFYDLDRIVRGEIVSRR
jgi:hypothetical protein